MYDEDRAAEGASVDADQDACMQSLLTSAPKGLFIGGEHRT